MIETMICGQERSTTADRSFNIGTPDNLDDDV